jgi:hypothetical protein
METEKTINEKILAITMLVKEKYPELQGFLGEMPVTIPNDSNPQITVKILQDYYNSLQALVKKYEEGGHTSK